MVEPSGGIPLPVFLVVLLGSVAAILYVVRAWERSVALAAALIVAGLGIWLWRLTSLQITDVPLAGVAVDA